MAHPGFWVILNIVKYYKATQPSTPAEWKLTEDWKITPNGCIQNRERPFERFRNAQHFYLAI